jgi:hypothetical protein
MVRPCNPKQAPKTWNSSQMVSEYHAAIFPVEIKHFRTGKQNRVSEILFASQQS